MLHCPKCGNEVDESAAFCPRCGAPLKTEAPAKSATPPNYRRDEKAEKGEKHEKRESSPFVWVMIGAVIIVVGLLSYFSASGYISSELVGPLLLLAIGVGLIMFGIFVYAKRGRRFPSPFV